jgi:glutathione synthase/RimK-type ligase-like ATP-grasp enzyme
MPREMQIASTEPMTMARLPCADRVGLAKLTTMAARGTDLRPLWQDLITKLIGGTIEAGEGLDLSLLAQLLGDKPAGLAIQQEILKSHQLFRSSCSTKPQALRVLALAAATDMGSNTPIEFLLEQAGIELMTLYVIPEVELPQPLPDHDIAIVIASDSEDCRDALRKIDEASSRWPRPLLNPPHRVGNLDRDKLHGLLADIEGLEIPTTTAVARAQLSDLARGAIMPKDIASDLAFPVIVRPRGSHAGAGLAKIDDRTAIERYLAEREDAEFFISRFVDYASDDNQFRKYRIVVVDGRPYAVHMAIAERWDIWYINAGMTQSASKRLEEETFMRTFDAGFAGRHEAALAGMIDRVGLDYFTMDCAETKDGSLLIFEADNTAIVHDMDPADIFPYKAPQMRKIFDAFATMLERRAQHQREQAA